MPADPYLIGFIALGVVGLFSGGIAWRELRWETVIKDGKFGAETKRRKNFGHPIYADFTGGKMSGEVRATAISGMKR